MIGGRALRAARRAWGALGAAVVGLCAATALYVIPLGPALAEVARPPGHIELRGDGAMLNFVRRAAEAYMGEHPDAVITASGGGSSRGLKSVLVGTADVALFSGEVPDNLEKLARDRSVALVKRDVYRDAVVVVVHEKNPLDDLSKDRVREIFNGSVTNWKELGGPDAPIVVLSLDPALGAYDTFKREVLGSGAVVTPRALTVPWSDFRRNLTEFAIGYIGLHAAGKYEAGAHKVIKVNGIAPTPEALASGRYPILRRHSLYRRADASDAVVRFVDYLLAPDKGQALVRSLGDVPIQ